MPLPRFARLDPTKRTRLLEVAAREFSEKGFEAASLNAILEGAGLGKSSYYYYFEDKEDLYVTCVLEAVVRLFQLGPRLDLGALTAKTFWPSVERWMGQLVQLASRHPGEMALFREAPTMRAVLGVRTEALIREVYGPVLRAVARGQELGCVRDDLQPEVLCLVGFAADATLDELLVPKLGPYPREQFQAHGRLVLDMWKRWLAPAPAPARRRRR